jgi:hypothetical protein
LVSGKEAHTADVSVNVNVSVTNERSANKVLTNPKIPEAENAGISININKLQAEDDCWGVCWWEIQECPGSWVSSALFSYFVEK